MTENYQTGPSGGDELKNLLEGTSYSAEEFATKNPVLSLGHHLKRGIVYSLAGAAVMGGLSFYSAHNLDDSAQVETAYTEGAELAGNSARLDAAIRIKKLKSGYDSRLDLAAQNIAVLEYDLNIADSRLRAFRFAIEKFTLNSHAGDLKGVLDSYDGITQTNLSSKLSRNDSILLRRYLDSALYSAFSSARLDLQSRANAEKSFDLVRNSYNGVIEELETLDFLEDDNLPFLGLLKEDLAEHAYLRSSDAMFSVVGDENDSSNITPAMLLHLYTSANTDMAGTKFARPHKVAFTNAMLALDLKTKNLQLSKDSESNAFFIDTLRELKGFSQIRNDKTPARRGVYTGLELRRMTQEIQFKLETESDPGAKAALLVLDNFAKDEFALRKFSNFESLLASLGENIVNADSVSEIDAVQIKLNSTFENIGDNVYGARALDNLRQLVAVKKPYLIRERDSNLLKIMSFAEMKRELTHSIQVSNDELDGFMVKYLWGDARTPKERIVNAKSKIKELDLGIVELAKYFSSRGGNDVLSKRLGLTTAGMDDISRAFRLYDRALTLSRSDDISDLESAVELMSDNDSSDKDCALEFDENIFYHHKFVELKKTLALAYMKSAGDILVSADLCDGDADDKVSKKLLKKTKRLLDLARVVSPGIQKNSVYARLVAEHHAEELVHKISRRGNYDSSLSASVLHHLRHGEFGESDDDAGEKTAWGIINELEERGFSKSANALKDQVPIYRSFVDVNSFFLLYDEIRNRMPSCENPRKTREYAELLKEDLSKATNSFEMSFRELAWLGNAEWVDTDGDGVLDSIVDESTQSVPEGILEILRNIPLLGSLLDPHRAGERLYADNYIMKILFGTAQFGKGMIWDSIKYAAGANDARPLDNISGGVGRILSPVGDALNIVSSVGRAGAATTSGVLKLVEFPFDAALGWNEYTAKGITHAGNALQFTSQSLWSAVPGGDASRRVHSGIPYLSHLFFGENQVPSFDPEKVLPLNPGVSLRALRRQRTATAVSRIYDCLTVGGMDLVLSHLVHEQLNKNKNPDNEGITGNDFDGGDAFGNNNITGSDGFLGGGSAGNALGGK